MRRTARTAADGVGARGWLEMGGEKKPLVMSDLSCADGCGRRGCNGVAGNGWGDGKGKERMGKEGTGRERKGQEEKGRERIGKDEKGRKREEVSDLGCADGCGRQVVWRTARTAADGVGARGWPEMGGKPLVMSDLGCADGCGRQMGAENCVDGCGRRGCNGVAGNGWEEESEKKPLVMSDLGCADGCGRQMGAENCADSCGRRGCKGVAGNGWGEEAPGDERPWLRGRLRTANGCGELRGRLRTAWVQGGGWKWVGRRSRW